MAGTGAIYRITTNGDTEATATAAGQTIEFNGGTVPDTTGRLVATGFRMTRDVGIHPNPRRALDLVQDNLAGVLDVTITGYFIDHDSTQGPLKFYEWQKDPATNASLPFGRFGLRLNDFASNALNLVPTSTVGYILYDIEINDLESPRDEVVFVARLYRNGTL